MSILIRGMEMPTSCGYCPFKYLTMEGDECMLDVAYTTYQSRPKDCPLFPVPPHGRLIDADALEAEFEKLAVQDNWYYNALHHAPTIIPADLEEEGGA